MIEYKNLLKNFILDDNSLFIISTPIGNLYDISVRALLILENVKFILCEDTRVTKKLLTRYKIKNKKLIPYNEFSSKVDRDNILKKILKEGHQYCLLSDAGTPLISDPGYKLIQECFKQNIKFTHIPGPSSVISSLVLSGLPVNSFIFMGFFEKTDSKKIKQLSKLLKYEETSIWFENPKRILKTLDLVNNIFGNRKISILRELTKLNEETIRGYTEEVIDILRKRKNLKGEITIVIEGFKPNKVSLKELNNLIIDNLDKAKSTKDLTKMLSDKTGLPRKLIYNEILKINNL